MKTNTKYKTSLKPKKVKVYEINLDSLINGAGNVNVKQALKLLTKENWVEWKKNEAQGGGKNIVKGLRVIMLGQTIYAQHLLEILKTADCEYVKIVCAMENIDELNEKFPLRNMRADKQDGNTWAGIAITPINSDVRWRCFLRGNRL